MTSKKADAHSLVTNIEDYVRAKYPDFAALFDYCKLFNLTSPRPGSSGVTLIVPTDKKYIDSIRELSFSSDAADVGKACDSLLALLMRKALLKASDWAAGDVSDMRYPSQQVSAKATTSSVELQANGKTYATLKQDPAFKVGFRSNIAVWLLTDGHMRAEMDADAPRKPRGRGRGARDKEGGNIAGGYDLVRAHAESDRFKIAIAAENEYVIQHMMPAQNGAPSFIAYLISFARFMYEHHRDEFFQCVLPLIRYRTTDFYMLFEPHRAAAPDQYLIADAFISEWWANYQFQRLVREDLISFRKWIDERLGEAASQVHCAIYTEPAEVALAIDEERAALTSVLQNPAQIADAVYKAYGALSDQNKIGSISDVYPPALAAYYNHHPHFKQMHDELAFIIEPLMIRNCRQFTVETFREIITIIANATHVESPADVESKLPLVNKRKLALMNTALVNEIRMFINSTMFFWIPITSTLMKNYPIDSVTTRPENADVIYNTDLALALHHERLYSAESTHIADANKELALAALNSLQPNHISAELLAKMKSLTQA
jgi:hypothetical protein